ncbi:hypothetical protein SDC9_134260 [bioreactor metagenome]|uniref:Uncharacterized protein n=1 Tax=bioreactor metagenome TaxID=1076179 RepID=A0A645DCS0_9ZZZZ
MQKKEARVYLLILLLVSLGALIQTLILSNNLPDDIDIKYQNLVLVTSLIVIAVTFVMLIRLSPHRNTKLNTEASGTGSEQSLQRIYSFLTTPARDMKGTLIIYASTMLVVSVINIIATLITRSMITDWKAVRTYNSLSTSFITSCCWWTVFTRVKLKKFQNDGIEKSADSKEDEA